MKKTFNSNLKDDLKKLLLLFKIKLGAKNQGPSLLIYGDSYDEDLKIQVWKTTFKNLLS